MSEASIPLDCRRRERRAGRGELGVEWHAVREAMVAPNRAGRRLAGARDGRAGLRLLGGPEINFANQAHVVGAAAEAMRRILIEHARRRARFKRGGDRQRVTLSLIDVALPEDCDELLALDDVLRRLEEKDARAAQVVLLRFFAGLTIEQTAQAMNLSPRTVKREWEWARAWLAKCLA